MNTNMGMRLRNPIKDTAITLSDSTKQAAVIHPNGRVLVYEPSVEIQTKDDLNVKNAKIYPRGISFTANNIALVYLLDVSRPLRNQHCRHAVRGILPQGGF